MITEINSSIVKQQTVISNEIERFYTNEKLKLKNYLSDLNKIESIYQEIHDEITRKNMKEIIIYLRQTIIKIINKGEFFKSLKPLPKIRLKDFYEKYDF